MMRTLPTFIIILSCTALLWAAPVANVYAQAQATKVEADSINHPFVQWTGQYPAHKPAERKLNAIRKIYNFLVQKDKENGLSRPVAIIGHTPLDFIVLDQGAQTLYQVEKKKTEKPRAIRRKDNYFTSLVGICALPGGELLFTDSRLNKVYRLSSDQKTLEDFADTLHLDQPTGIAYSTATGQVWVVETGAHRISVFTAQGQLLKRIGSRGDDTGKFNFPTSICIDPSGDAYVVDAMNFRVQIFNKEGVFVTTFGEAGDFSGSFARPKGIATDTYGHIYISDALFHVVQIFDRAGNFLYSFGKQGREQAEFWMPSGIYIDNKNYIYVADSYNSRVQIFQLINGS